MLSILKQVASKRYLLILYICIGVNAAAMPAVPIALEVGREANVPILWLYQGYSSY